MQENIPFLEPKKEFKKAAQKALEKAQVRHSFDQFFSWVGLPSSQILVESLKFLPNAVRAELHRRNQKKEERTKAR